MRLAILGVLILTMLGWGGTPLEDEITGDFGPPQSLPAQCMKWYDQQGNPVWDDDCIGDNIWNWGGQ